MSWGNKSQPERSTASQLIPLLILGLVVAALAWVGYQIYLSFGKMRETASKKMDHRHIKLSKDGMQVGVKDRTSEQYVDKTQRYVVKAWNLRSDEGKNKSKSK